MSTKRKEARLLAYSLLYDKTGKLVTERVSTDITKLKKFLKKEDYVLMTTIVRELTVHLDTIHNKIEAHLNARKMDA